MRETAAVTGHQDPETQRSRRMPLCVSVSVWLVFSRVPVPSVC